MSQGSKSRVFLATLVFALYQIIVGETYPGLHAPKFKTPGLKQKPREPWVQTHASVRVGFADGSSEERRLTALVPRIQMKMGWRIDGRLRSQGVEHPVALREWLRDQVRDHFPGREAVRIELLQIEGRESPTVETLFVDDRSVE